MLNPIVSTSHHHSQRDGHMTVRARLCASLLVALAVTAAAQTAAAQTHDDFFADDHLQDLRIVINTRDWESLKEHFDENTYYPADLQWNGISVRNVGIRS